MGGTELIATVTKNDLEISYFRVGGNGGQHRDKTSAGVRIYHPASGAVGEASDSRSQLENKQSAFRKMAQHPRFKIWVAQVSALETPEQYVDRVMTEDNIKIEYRENNKWVNLPTKN